MNYQKGFEFIIYEKDMSKEDNKDLKILISNFLVNKGYVNPKIHKIGEYNRNLEETWEDCKELIKK